MVSVILVYLDIQQLIHSSDPIQSKQIPFDFQSETFRQLFHLTEAFEHSVAVHSDRGLEMTPHALKVFLHIDSDHRTMISTGNNSSVLSSWEVGTRLFSPWSGNVTRIRSLCVRPRKRSSLWSTPKRRRLSSSATGCRFYSLRKRRRHQLGRSSSFIFTHRWRTERPNCSANPLNSVCSSGQLLDTTRVLPSWFVLWNASSNKWQATKAFSALFSWVWASLWRGKEELGRSDSRPVNEDWLTIFDPGKHVQTFFSTQRAQDGDCQALYELIRKRAWFLLTAVKGSQFDGLTEKTCLDRFLEFLSCPVERVSPGMFFSRRSPYCSQPTEGSDWQDLFLPSFNSSLFPEFSLHQHRSALFPSRHLSWPFVSICGHLIFHRTILDELKPLSLVDTTLLTSMCHRLRSHAKAVRHLRIFPSTSTRRSLKTQRSSRPRSLGLRILRSILFYLSVNENDNDVNDQIDLGDRFRRSISFSPVVQYLQTNRVSADQIRSELDILSSWIDVNIRKESSLSRVTVNSIRRSFRPGLLRPSVHVFRCSIRSLDGDGIEASPELDVSADGRQLLFLSSSPRKSVNPNRIDSFPTIPCPSVMITWGTLQNHVEAPINSEVIHWFEQRHLWMCHLDRWCEHTNQFWVEWTSCGHCLCSSLSHRRQRNVFQMLPNRAENRDFRGINLSVNDASFLVSCKFLFYPADMTDGFCKKRMKGFHWRLIIMADGHWASLSVRFVSSANQWTIWCRSMGASEESGTAGEQLLQVYVEGAFQLDIHLDEHRLILRDTDLEIFREDDRRQNTSSAFETLRIECQSLTYLQQLFGTLHEHIRSANCPLDELAAPPSSFDKEKLTILLKISLSENDEQIVALSEVLFTLKKDRQVWCLVWPSSFVRCWSSRSSLHSTNFFSLPLNRRLG